MYNNTVFICYNQERFFKDTYTTYIYTHFGNCFLLTLARTLCECLSICSIKLTLAAGYVFRCCVSPRIHTLLSHFRQSNIPISHYVRYARARARAIRAYHYTLWNENRLNYMKQFENVEGIRVSITRDEYVRKERWIFMNYTTTLN